MRSNRMVLFIQCYFQWPWVT